MLPARLGHDILLGSEALDKATRLFPEAEEQPLSYLRIISSATEPTYNDWSPYHPPDVVARAYNPWLLEFKARFTQVGLLSETLAHTPAQEKRKEFRPLHKIKRKVLSLWHHIFLSKQLRRDLVKVNVVYKSVLVQPMRREASRRPSANFRTASIDSAYLGNIPRKVKARSTCLGFLW